MPWDNSPAFDITEAIGRGQDVYEVLFNSWGFRAVADDAGDYRNLQWPPTGIDTASPNAFIAVSLPSSIAGIALGPQSTVDRCWVSYNLGKHLTPTLLGGDTNRLHRLSVDTPLLFTQEAHPGQTDDPGGVHNPLATQVSQGALYVFPMADDPGAGNLISFNYPNLQETTIVPTTYTPAVVGGGTRIFFDGNADGVHPLLPKLHLYLYLKAPVFHGPLKRFPLQVQGTVGSQTPITAGSEQVVAQIPTFGRKRIHIMMMASQTASFRIGAFRAIGQVPDLQEQPVDFALNIPAATPVITSPCAELCDADYTNLYVTMSAPGTCLFQVTAYD